MPRVVRKCHITGRQGRWYVCEPQSGIARCLGDIAVVASATRLKNFFIPIVWNIQLKLDVRSGFVNRMNGALNHTIVTIGIASSCF